MKGSGASGCLHHHKSCFMCFLQHHVSCGSHLRSLAYIVFLITWFSLIRRVGLFDVMSHLQAKTFSRWLHTVDLPWTFRNSCMGRGLAFGIVGVARRHLAISTERSTHAILQKLFFGDGLMRKGSNPSRERSKTPRLLLSSQRRYKKRIFEEGSTTRVEASSKGKKGQLKMRRSSSVKENHAEMYGRKWETFNEAKVIFHHWEHVFAADQKTSLLAVLLDFLMHHCDARACEKNTTTGVADDCRKVSSDGNFAGVIPTHTWGLEFWQCVLLTGLELRL